MDDLTVMSERRGPLQDGHARQAARRAMVRRAGRAIRRPDQAHPRPGVFYACVSAGDVNKPDGEPFENNAENEAFLGVAARYARWLGYVPFDRLVDDKNDPPVVRQAPSSDPPTAHVFSDDLDIEDLDPDAIGVSAGLH